MSIIVIGVVLFALLFALAACVVAVVNSKVRGVAIAAACLGFLTVGASVGFFAFVVRRM